MEVKRANQLGGFDLFPDPEVYLILSDHPSQEHIDALAGGIPEWRRNMFLSSFQVFQGEKVLSESDQAFFNIFIVSVHPPGECILKTGILAVMVLEKTDEIVEVIRIESPVFEIFKLF